MESYFWIIEDLEYSRSDFSVQTILIQLIRVDDVLMVGPTTIVLSKGFRPRDRTIQTSSIMLPIYFILY